MRNPYAGIWLLPILLTLTHNFLANIGLGIAIGMVQGGGGPSASF